MKKASDYEKFLTQKIKEQRQINQNLYYEMEDHKKKADQLKTQILKIRKTQGQFKRKIQQLTDKVSQYEKKQQQQKKFQRIKKPSVDKVPRPSSSKINNQNFQSKNKTLAQNIVQAWKKKEQQVPNITRQGLQLMKTNERKNLQKIKKLEQQIQNYKDQKQQLIQKSIYYQRALSIKGAQFVSYIRRSIQKSDKSKINSEQKLNLEQTKKFNQLLELLKRLIETKHTLTQRNIQQQKQQANQQKQMQKRAKQQIKNQQSSSKADYMNVSKSKLNKQLRKPPPVVKKNVFGYFQNPQFNQYIPKVIQTKHPLNTKFTQTLTDDLSILITRPVIQIVVFDGNIKPQRNRARTDYYVRLYCNLQKDSYIDTPIKSGYEPLWNQTLLMKQYDFPFMHIQLMNQGKGIRDYAIGKGKTPVSSANQKIVKIVDSKQQFQGRVRLGIRYPKKTIFQFTVTSVQLIKPQFNKLLKETISINCPLNPKFKINVSHPQFISYCDANFLIPQSYTDSPMIASALQSDKKGKVSLQLMSQKQGDKQISIKIDEGWSVVLRGHIVMIISQQQQPQKIQDLQKNHRYFSIRASHPIISAQYSNKTLYSSIKFPLVFRYFSDYTSLKIFKDKEDQPTIYQPLLNQTNQMIQRQFIKVPKKVYQIYLQSIQGQKAILIHNTGLLQRMLKQIKLKVGDKQFFVQSQDLMENYYKIIQKTFKKVGYFKFKLGYKVHENQLRMHESQKKQDQSSVIKDQPNINKIQLKDRYLTFQVTSAFLPQHSDLSSYSVYLQGKKTIELKGNRPKWEQQFILQYEQNISYQLIQHGFFGQKVISKGRINIKDDFKILRLGVYCARISQKGVLYFGRVTLPNKIYNLLIKDISSQIQEEADWIGQIDPYIRLFSMNRQIYQSSVVDGGGRKSSWNKVNFNVLLSNSQVLGYIYDQDLIGKDDYLGQFRIDIKQQKMSQIKTKIIKQGKIGGRITLNGQFQQIKLEQLEIPNMIDSLKVPDTIKNKKTLYRIKIYAINLIKNQYEDDQGWIQTSCNTYSPKFFYSKNKYQEIDYTMFIFEEEKVNFKLYHHSKSFFSNSISIIGQCQYQLPSVVIFTKSQINLQSNGQVIGLLKIAIQPVDNMKIGIIGDCTSALNQIVFESDVGNTSMLYQNLNQKSPKIYNPLLVIYHQKVIPKFKTTNKKQENEEIAINQIVEQSTDKVKLYQMIYKEQVYSKFSMIIYEYERKKFPTTQIVFNPQRYAKQFQFLKWQPFYQVFNASFDLQMNIALHQVSWNSRHSLIQFNTSQSILKQQSLIRKENNERNSFLTQIIPNQIKVYEGVRQILKQKFVQQKGFFLDKKGILYYKLRDMKLEFTQITLQWVFIRFSKIMQSKQQTQMILIIQKSEVETGNIIMDQKQNQNNNSKQQKHTYREYSQILYSNLEKIGNDGFYGQNLTYLIPGQKLTKIKLIFVIRKKQSLQEIQRQTIQIGSRQGTSYPISQEIDHKYSMHCYLKTFHHSALKQKVQHQKQSPFIIDIKHIQLFTSTDYSGTPKIKLTIQKNSIVIPTQGKQTNFIHKPIQNLKFIIPNNDKDSQFSFYGQIWIQGILTEKTIGSFEIVIKKKMLTLNNKGILSGQIKYGNQIQGKVNIQFVNINDLKYLNLHLNSIFLKDQSLWNLNLQITSKDRQKIIQKTLQKMIKSQTQWNYQDTQDKNILLLFDDISNNNSFKIKVTNSKNNKILGQFNLKLPIIQQKNKITLNYPISQSLRQGSLNGVLTGNLQYVSNYRDLVSIQEPNSAGFINISIYGFSFVALTNELQMIIQSNSRTLHTRKKQLIQNNNQIQYQFNVEDGYEVKCSLVSKKQIVGIAVLKPPMIHNQEKIVKFVNPHSLQPHAVCKVKISHILGECMEIVSLQAEQLIDTQYFVNMTPFIEIKTSYNHYITDIGKGKNSLFWKVGLVQQLKPDILQIIEITIKDQDMFFDDYIGMAKIDMQQQGQNQYKFKGQKGQDTGILKTKKRFIPQKNEQQIKNVKQDYIQDKSMVLILNRIIDKEITSMQFFINGFSLNKISCLKPQIINQIPIILSVRFKSLQKLKLQVLCQNSQNSMNMRQNIQLSPENVKKQPIQTQLISYNLKQLNQKILTIQQIFIWSTRIQAYSKKKIVISNNDNIISLKQQSLKQFYQTQQERNKIIKPTIATDRFNITYKGNGFLSLVQKGILKVTIFQKEKDVKWAQCLFQIKDTIEIHKKIFETELKKDNSVIGKVFLRLNVINFQGSYQLKANQPKKSIKKWYEITIKKAQMQKDIQFFGKMDPYCIIKYLNVEFKTSVQQDIGKNPIWNQTFMFQQSNQNQIFFKLMDSQIMKDRQIGQCKQKIPDFKDLSQIKQFQTPVLVEGKAEGKLFYEIKSINTFIVFTNILYGHKPFNDFQILNKGRASKLIQGLVYPIDINQEIIIQNKNTQEKRVFTYQDLKTKQFYKIILNNVNIHYLIYQ